MRTSLKWFLFFLLVLAPIPALADTYTLNVDHTGSFGSPPYGTVDVLDVGTNKVEIIVNLASGLRFINGGQPASAFAFNPGGITVALVAPLPAGWSLGSGGQADGFGNFQYNLSCDICGSGGSNPQPGSLTFYLTGSGLSASSFKTLSTTPPGDTKAYFAADVLGNGATGWVGATNPPSVPEPASFVTLGFAILAVGFVTRKLGAVSLGPK